MTLQKKLATIIRGKEKFSNFALNDKQLQI